MPAIRFIDSRIKPDGTDSQGPWNPVVDPIAKYVQKTLKSMDTIKENLNSASKVCTLTAYCMSAVAFAMGRPQFGSRLIDYVSKTNNVIDVGFLLSDGSEMISNKPTFSLEMIQQLALITAEVGGFALWLNALGLVALTHVTAIAAVSGVAICVVFVFVFGEGLKALMKSTTNDQLWAAYWKTAHGLSEVALHTMQTVGGGHVGVMFFGTLAAGTAIKSVLNPVKSQENDEQQVAPQRNFVQSRLDEVHMATNTVSGVQSTTKFSLSVIEIASLVSEVAKEKFAPLYDALDTSRALVSATALLGRAKEWSKYHDGWREWSGWKMANRVALTTGQTFKFMKFLNKIGIPTLGRLSATAFGSIKVINLLGDGPIMISAACNIVDTLKELNRDHEIEPLKRKKMIATLAFEASKIATISLDWIAFGLGLNIYWQASVTIAGALTSTSGLYKHLLKQKIARAA